MPLRIHTFDACVRVCTAIILSTGITNGSDATATAKGVVVVLLLLLLMLLLVLLLMLMLMQLIIVLLGYVRLFIYP